METMRIKAKCIHTAFEKGEFRIFKWSPLGEYKSSGLKFGSNGYAFTFSTKGQDSYISEGETHMLELEEISFDARWGGTYRIVDCLSLAEQDFSNMTKEESFEIIKRCTSSDTIANNILNAYPNFIELVLTEGKDVIDIKKIHGVGTVYLNAYTRTLISKYKYYALIRKLSRYELTMEHCKRLFSTYENEANIVKRLKRNPYEVLISCLEMSFSKADGIILEVDSNFEASKERAMFLILDVIKISESGGSTKVHGDDIYYYIEDKYGNNEKLMELIIPVAMESEHIYHDEKSGFLSSMETYLVEKNIADFIDYKLRKPIVEDYDWQQFTKIKDGVLTEEQQAPLQAMCDNNVVILSGGAGCVDADTEYFNGIEWKKISEYDGGMVMSLDYNEDTNNFTESLTMPNAYINKECDVFVEITVDGKPFLFSEEHRHIITVNGKLEFKTFEGIFSPNPYTHESKLVGDFGFNAIRQKNGSLNQKNIKLSIIDDIRIKIKNARKYCFTVDSGILLLRKHGVEFITGNSGKTASMLALLEMLEYHGKSYTCVSATGKASARFTEQTNRPCSTIHRATMNRTIETDYLIIEEYSFLSIDLMAMLINAIENPNIKILLLGDNYQIAPIGKGKPMHDIIASKRVKVCELTKCFRFGEGGMLAVATRCRNGEFYIDEDKRAERKIVLGKNKDYKYIQFDGTLEPLLDTYVELLKKNKPEDICVTTPRNIGDFGAININNKLQLIVNPPTPNKKEVQSHYYLNGVKYSVTFRVDDLVMQTKNNYEMISEEQYYEIKDDDLLSKEDIRNNEKIAVFNGQIGRVVRVSENTLSVLFGNDLVLYDKNDMQQLVLAYAINIYKLQGSQCKHIITLTLNQHNSQITRNIMYTALTRASKSMTEIGDIEAMKLGVLKLDGVNRDTLLCDMLTN